MDVRRREERGDTDARRRGYRESKELFEFGETVRCGLKENYSDSLKPN